MEKAKLKVVWTKGNTIWAGDCKVQAMHSTDVSWDVYQRRPGLVRRLLPLPVFLAEFVPGNERVVCDKLGIELCTAQELEERYKAGEFHDSKQTPKPRKAAEDPLESKTNAQLQDMLRERGLPIYGAKADLIERLEAN